MYCKSCSQLIVLFSSDRHIYLYMAPPQNTAQNPRPKMGHICQMLLNPTKRFLNGSKMRYFVKVQRDTILIYHDYFSECGRWGKVLHYKTILTTTSSE